MQQVENSDSSSGDYEDCIEQVVAAPQPVITLTKSNSAESPNSSTLESSDHVFHIVVRPDDETLTGRSEIALTVAKSAYVREIKKFILKEYSKIPLDRQKLCYDGRELQDSQSIAELGLASNNIFSLQASQH